MASFYDSVREKVENTMIDIKDFKKYHTHALSENDSIGVYKIKKLNNERYETFFETILKPRADSEGKIICDKAAFLWVIFEDSKEVLGTYNHIEHLRPTDRKVVDFWINEFKRPIEELYEYGVNTISSAYGILIDFYREWMIKEKYERIYSKGKTFDEWFELAENNKGLLQGDEYPYDVKEIGEKAKIIITVRN